MASATYRIILRQLVDEYLALQCTRPVTQTSTRYHLASLLALCGGWQARRLKPQQIMDYLDSQRRAGVCPATATHRVKLLRTVLRWGVSSGRLAANPLDGLRLPTPRPRRIDPPNTAEARRMARAAAPHVRRVIVLGMLQALRRRKLRMKTVIGYAQFRPRKLLSPSISR